MLLVKLVLAIIDKIVLTKKINCYPKYVPTKNWRVSITLELPTGAYYVTIEKIGEYPL